MWSLVIQQCCSKAAQYFLLYDSCVSSPIWPTQILHGWNGWLYLDEQGYIEVASDLAAYSSLSSPAETFWCDLLTYLKEWIPKD